MMGFAKSSAVVNGSVTVTIVGALDGYSSLVPGTVPCCVCLCECVCVPCEREGMFVCVCVCVQARRITRCTMVVWAQR